MDKSELYQRDLAGLQWRVSSKSHWDDPPDSCVEVATFPDGVVAIRDSHDTTRPALMFTAAEWSAFTAAVHDGEF